MDNVCNLAIYHIKWIWILFGTEDIGEQRHEDIRQPWIHIRWFTNTTMKNINHDYTEICNSLVAEH